MATNKHITRVKTTLAGAVWASLWRTVSEIKQQ